MNLFSRKINQTLMAACAGLMLAAGAALAQQAPAADAPGRPDAKTVGDWTVRCFPIQSPSPCDIFQEQDYQKTGQRVLSISIAYVPSMDKHAIQISVPLDISIPKGVTLQTDTYTSPVLKYRRCDRNGCYIEMAVDNGLVEGLAKSGDKGKVNIAADNGKNYTLNFSLKGFAQAHDDMVAQARAKAKPVEQSAAATPAKP
ncbi:MAG TPA: invasion associated locus B family protein [Rhizomicrobium sp.]|jgi:invasion protein IalB